MFNIHKLLSLYFIFKTLCADIVSVLAMTAIDTKEVLKYRLLGSHQDIGMWGHEYIR